MNTRLAFLLIAVALLFNSSCKKDPDPEPEPADPDMTAVSDNAVAENAFNDAFSMTLQAASEHNFNFNKRPVCADITIDTSANPDKITLDFGAGCTGNDNRTRTGKIIATFTGRYIDSGTVITLTTDNYSVDSYKVDGTKKVTNMGTRNGGHPYFKIEVKNGRVITPTTDTLTWQSEREREWSEGYDTRFNITDDVYLVTGTASGTNRKGLHYDAETKSPLKVKIGCRYIVSGVLDVTPDGLPVRSIDYGTGDCDNKVAVTVSGKTYNITVQ